MVVGRGKDDNVSGVSDGGDAEVCEMPSVIGDGQLDDNSVGLGARGVTRSRPTAANCGWKDRCGRGGGTGSVGNEGTSDHIGGCGWLGRPVNISGRSVSVRGGCFSCHNGWRKLKICLHLIASSCNYMNRVTSIKCL